MVRVVGRQEDVRGAHRPVGGFCHIADISTYRKILHFFPAVSGRLILKGLNIGIGRRRYIILHVVKSDMSTISDDIEGGKRPQFMRQM